MATKAMREPTQRELRACAVGNDKRSLGTKKASYFLLADNVLVMFVGRRRGTAFDLDDATFAKIAHALEVAFTDPNRVSDVFDILQQAGF